MEIEAQQLKQKRHLNHYDALNLQKGKLTELFELCQTEEKARDKKQGVKSFKEAQEKTVYSDTVSVYINKQMK